MVSAAAAAAERRALLIQYLDQRAGGEVNFATYCGGGGEGDEV